MALRLIFGCLGCILFYLRVPNRTVGGWSIWHQWPQHPKGTIWTTMPSMGNKCYVSKFVGSSRPLTLVSNITDTSVTPLSGTNHEPERGLQEPPPDQAPGNNRPPQPAAREATKPRGANSPPPPAGANVGGVLTDSTFSRVHVFVV